MENELPKTEATGVEAGGERKETGMMTKKFLVAKVNMLKKCVSKMSKTTRSFVIVLVVFVVLLAGFYYYKGIFIAATVNGSPISRLSVIRELEKKAGKDTLDTIITKKLIESEMKKSGIVIKDADIDAEMKKIEDQVTAQGGTLDEALAGQGMTLAELREQIVINKELEQILSDKIAVSDDEVNQYLADNKTLAPKGVSSDDMKNQAREQLKGQKFNTEAGKWVNDIKAKAQINYFVQY